MSNLLNFSYQSTEIRVDIRDGQPWFAAKDVCQVLDIVNHYQAVDRLDGDERGVCTVYTPGGPQDLVAVSESGLYALIFTSRKPEAKAFRKWVTGVVLPSIRRTGGYAAGGGGLSPQEITARYIALLEERVAELKTRAAPGRPWTPAEDAELWRLAGLGHTPGAIGQQLGRARSSVRGRLALLRARPAGGPAGGQTGGLLEPATTPQQPQQQGAQP